MEAKKTLCLLLSWSRVEVDKVGFEGVLVSLIWIEFDKSSNLLESLSRIEAGRRALDANVVCGCCVWLQSW